MAQIITLDDQGKRKSISECMPHVKVDGEATADHQVEVLRTAV